jgi:hypothetical protein
MLLFRLAEEYEKFFKEERRQLQTRCSDGNLRLVGAGRIQHAQVPSSAN